MVAPAAAQVPGSQAPPPAAQTPAAPAPTAPRSMSPFLGGIPSGEPTKEPLSLSIADTISRALEHNLGVLLAGEEVDRARGSRWRTLSDLLPNVSGGINESRQVVNLAAYGFPLPAGIPAIVGPFNVFDARVFLSQSVLDFKALNDARAETHNVVAARHDYRAARDLVVLIATVSYAQALAGSARVDAARAQVETAQALFVQATDMKQNGLIAGIEVLRAEVQLDSDRQRETAARNDFEKAKLQLARLIGLPIGQIFTLSNELTSVTSSRDDARRGARSRLQDTARVPGRARARPRRRGDPTGGDRRKAAGAPRHGQLRRARADAARRAQHLQRHGRRERSDLPGGARARPAARSGCRASDAGGPMPRTPRRPSITMCGRRCSICRPARSNCRSRPGHASWRPIS